MNSNANQPARRCIALIGLRGAGKTSVAKELQAMIGGEYVDTDDLIIKEAKQSISEIFVAEGEAGFRRREREIIERITQHPPAILSLGGGAILDSKNREAIGQVATVVWLTATPEVLWKRIESDPRSPQTRPALTLYKGLAELKKLYEDRKPLYRETADLTVDTTDRTPSEIAQWIVDQIKSIKH